jgi:threonine dehydratase
MAGIVDLLKIRNAYERIKPYIRETPLEFSWYYSQFKQQVYCKYENCQLTGSFKIRGALNKMLQLGPEAQKKGVITASAGNHAQGLGFAARLLKIPTTIIIPKNTPQIKRRAIQQYPVELQIHGEIYDDAEIFAREQEKVTGKIFISAYNDPEVIAGQGTIGLELVKQLPELDIILVPVGGGGLIGGIATGIKALKPNVKVFGVQSETSPVMLESLKHGHIVDIPMEESIAEGLHGGIEKGSITFPLVQQYCDGILLVNEVEIKQAIRDMVTYHHMIVEGSGAVSTAATIRYQEKFQNKKVVAVISGGNLDVIMLKKILNEQ